MFLPVIIVHHVVSEYLFRLIYVVSCHCSMLFLLFVVLIILRFPFLHFFSLTFFSYSARFAGYDSFMLSLGGVLHTLMATAYFMRQPGRWCLR